MEWIGASLTSPQAQLHTDCVCFHCQHRKFFGRGSEVVCLSNPSLLNSRLRRGAQFRIHEKYMDAL
jgi:hypothetical protein